jgi:transposase
MGKKKALIAVSHSILVIAYHVLQTHTPYQELGSDYFERRNGDKQRKRLIRQLESLGLKVTAEEIKEAA